jgi:hypothetical protein
MPRLTAEQWAEGRALREAGASFEEVARQIGVSKNAVVKASKREGWGDGSDVADLIRRKVSEKVSGVVSAATAQRKAEIIDAAADQAVQIIIRHRDDWDTHHQTFTVTGIAADFDLGKSAKISAEMLAIRQKAERIAWNMDERDPPAGPPGGSLVLQLGGRTLTDDELGWTR